MFMISLAPKWSGTVKSMPVQEFLETAEEATRVGNWSDADMVQVATLKLAKTFHSGCEELQNPGISTWVHFKENFRDRFREAHTDHYTTSCNYKLLERIGKKASGNLQMGGRHYVRKLFSFLHIRKYTTYMQ
jgi:hypothetical protein